MSLQELCKELERYYEIGKQRKEVVPLVQCFGIKYSDVITNNNIRVDDIVVQTSLRDTKLATEIRKGMKLAKYVMIKNNI